MMNSVDVHVALHTGKSNSLVQEEVNKLLKSTSFCWWKKCSNTIGETHSLFDFQICTGDDRRGYISTVHWKYDKMGVGPTHKLQETSNTLLPHSTCSLHLLRSLCSSPEESFMLVKEAWQYNPPFVLASTRQTCLHLHKTNTSIIMYGRCENTCSYRIPSIRRCSRLVTTLNLSPHLQMFWTK